MKRFTRLFKVLLVMALLYAFVFFPIPFYLEIPGKAFGLDQMVEVNSEFSEEPGDFYLTTVSIQQATPLTALSSVLPFRDLVSEANLFGDIEDFEEYDVMQQYYMNSSINTAIQVAFEAADADYELHYNGVYVLQVLEDSTFADQLQIGDTVKKTDGIEFKSSNEFIDYIAHKEVGDRVTIDIDRDGELITASGELILLESGLPGIGIGLADNTSIETNPDVFIHSGAIGGPSAGLMFSLQIYKQLTGENIHGTYDIAGTGTIAPDGAVGRIGGIAKKVVASDEQGIDYFFAPDDEINDEIKAIYPELQSNYEEAVDAAEAIDTEMEIIPVKNISDALEFLENLNQEAAVRDFKPRVPFNVWDDLNVALKKYVLS